MTATAKRWITLDQQEHRNRERAEKFESGYYYNPMKRYFWEDKAKESARKKLEVEALLTDKDKDDIEAEYLCELFNREI